MTLSRFVALSVSLTLESITIADKASPGTLNFKRLPGNSTIARPAPEGEWDDLHQIEFTFLPPAKEGGRWSLYHASYSSSNENPHATKADCGYKQAIGMYSFDWESAAGPVAGVPAADFQAPQTMRVGVAQIMALDGDREGNFVRIEHAIVKAVADGADLVVFPETIILGWDNPLAWTEAHPIPGADTARLSALARANGVALVVGLAEKANATTLHDTAVLIDRTGELLHTHRKINILSTLMEHPYTPGPIDKANIASVPLRLASGAEVRVGVLICADTFLTPVLEAMAGTKPQLVAVPYLLRKIFLLILSPLRSTDLFGGADTVGVAARRGGPTPTRAAAARTCGRRTGATSRSACGSWRTRLARSLSARTALVSKCWVRGKARRTEDSPPWRRPGSAACRRCLRIGTWRCAWLPSD